MRFEPKDPPRRYEVGWGERFDISDCGTLALDPDEQVTFVTEAGGELDVTRKDWGFYAAPSLNSRLARFRLRAVLVKNRVDNFFVLLVEAGKEAAFQRYVDGEPLQIVAWLDSTESLKELDAAVARHG